LDVTVFDLARGVETLEVVMVFIMAYLSYITADLVGWSGIISLIGELPAPINCLIVELPD
jgi:hypothetical protein